MPNLKVYDASTGTWRYVSQGVKGDTGSGGTGVTGIQGITGPYGTRYIVSPLCGADNLNTSALVYFRIPSGLNNYNLVSVAASVGTGSAGSSSSGLPTFSITNATDSTAMLSTNLTVDAGEYTSATAATPAVIDTSHDDVVTDDLIQIACTVAGSGTTYAVVTTGWAPQ
jgi:hypothetical protein